MYLYIPAFASEPSFTGFRDVLCDANMPVPDAQAQRRVGRRFSPVHDRGGAEAIYTIRTSLVQACPGIQVQTDLITVHTKYILMFTCT